MSLRGETKFQRGNPKNTCVLSLSYGTIKLLKFKKGLEVKINVQNWGN